VDVLSDRQRLGTGLPGSGVGAHEYPGRARVTLKPDPCQILRFEHGPFHRFAHSYGRHVASPILEPVVIPDMNILVLNCGSSTVKFQIIATDLERIQADADRGLARGTVDRIGGQSLIRFEARGSTTYKGAEPIRDHRAAIDRIIRWIISDESNIESIRSLGDIHGVGHRVVHGGETFQASVPITTAVLAGIEDCIELAPLHNPANIKGIRATSDLFGPGMTQVAVFDTAFHSTMPASSYLYGVPYQLYRRHKIRRYGFHGTSHRYISYRYRKLYKLEPTEVDIISLHLGNGCSACAIKDGKSIDTSMGMTPLEGLLMGTRAGDIDPSIIELLMHIEGMTIQEVDTLLNKHSGLLGLSGLTSDMRELLEERELNQDRRATLAIEIFCNRVRKYIGAYLALMGGARAVVFTGGIGENSAPIRKQICQDLAPLGLEMDDDANANAHPGSAERLSKDGSRVGIYCIPTNEELLIARDTVRCLSDPTARENGH